MFKSLLNRSATVALLTLLMVMNAWSGSYRVLHNFNQLAQNPSSGLVVDTAGNAYGTTASGGYHNAGTVYQLSPAGGYQIIYAFSGLDGASPLGNLAFDSAGNLYGMTVDGGAYSNCPPHPGCGSVFRLTPPSNGNPWTETVLYSFTGGSDGAFPEGGLTLDSAGNLYGSSYYGGANHAGTVFEIVSGTNNQWTENVLYSFAGGLDGGNPESNVVFDESGNLCGTASQNGPAGEGTVFCLSPAGGKWTFNVIYAFGSAGSGDGNHPLAGLVIDATGNLYGTTIRGGAHDFGTVFELTPGISGDWTESILHDFASGDDGALPEANLVFDQAGNLYGTTMAGGKTNGNPPCVEDRCGTVFRLTRTEGGQWIEGLFGFPGDASLGGFPDTPVFIDGEGNIYGTTRNGGRYAWGVVFRITP